jgi:pilus assembly protein Flp/PilA
MRSVLTFLRDRSGHTAIEYGMIASLIIILIITAIGSMGLTVEKMFIPLEKAIAAPKA